MFNGLLKNSCISAASILMLAAFFLQPRQLSAQQNLQGVEPQKLAVDVISVRKLGRVHGIIFAQNPRSVSIVVRRDWLKEKHAKFAEKHFGSEEAELGAQRDVLKKRIADWRNEYEGEDKAVIDEFLDDNEELLELDQPIDVSGLRFTVVTVERKDVRKIYEQSAEKEKLAGIAWSEKIANVETTNATVLRRKLTKAGVDIDGYALKLGSEIPPVLEPEDKWNARKALVEFAVLPRVEFQGTGTMFLRRGLNADPAAAIKSMLQGAGGLGGISNLDQLGRDLGLPEFRQRAKKQDKNAWMKPMIEAAEKENRRTFSVAKMTQGDTVTVDMQLYFKAADQRWYPLASFSNSARVDEQSTDDVDQVQQDPNVSKALNVMKQLGIADSGLLDKALKGGAATKQALEASMSDLDEYVQRYAFEIDNPPVESK